MSGLKKSCADTMDLFECIPLEEGASYEAAPLVHVTKPKRKSNKVTGLPNTSNKAKSASKKKATPQKPSPDLDERFLKDTEVAARFGVCRQTIWRWAAIGDFPQPIKLSAGVTRWRRSELLAHEAVLASDGPLKQLCSKNAQKEHNL
ncbi:helix-turn-helix transcriptional regulator [Shimia thalassica]|uniref:helix-turn-helix transcriptional regulator n=1 Tax=Shimia thalassica TaxID=1715693 RepID=UPI0026E1523F|nr:AlpA family phage regulatory protein [Shimia thalassica]MDO6482007.1 AlpA family phage regulatory protein [Shimia thalassica]